MENELVESIFQVIDKDLNDISTNPEDHGSMALVKLLSTTSKSAYDHYNGLVDELNLDRLLGKMGLDASPENLRQFLFHYGFQYGFSAQKEFAEMTESVLDEIKKLAERYEQKSNKGDIEFTDELVANVVIDRAAGFLQLSVGGRTITCKNIQTVDILEV